MSIPVEFTQEAATRLDAYTREVADEIYKRILPLRGMSGIWRVYQSQTIGNALALRLAACGIRQGTLVSVFIDKYNAYINHGVFEKFGITVMHFLERAFEGYVAPTQSPEPPAEAIEAPNEPLGALSEPLGAPDAI